MNISLYAPRPDIARIEFVGGYGTMSVHIDADGWSGLIMVEGENPQILFDLFADTSKHVANLYSSIVDNELYTEWLGDKPKVGFVISEQGQLLQIRGLPKEEVPE